MSLQKVGGASDLSSWRYRCAPLLPDTPDTMLAQKLFLHVVHEETAKTLIIIEQEEGNRVEGSRTRTDWTILNWRPTMFRVK